ncbi:MAG: TonB-dependent receptor, partial [Sphingobacteriaceae bacterium]
MLDAQTGETLPGAVVSIPELKISTSTNTKGEFTLNNAPNRGRFVLEIRYIGYKTYTQTIDLSTTEVFVFKLSTSTIEAHEVVITGSVSSADNRQNSANIALVGKEQLLNQSTNIVDALAKIPGVSQITTGGGISKPVIRGLGYNRVITLADGTKQEGQQWGDEHGIEIDQFNVDRVEILKGAASLLYGSDALGGVINIVDPLPAGDGEIKGDFLTNYANNNGLIGHSFMLFGNKNGFIWRSRISAKSAKGYQTPINRIPNTGFNELDLSGQFGLNKNWGYTHLSLSSFKSDIGLPDFLPNATGDFEDANGNVLSNEEVNGRTLLLPFQSITHKKIALNSTILIGKGRIRSNLSYQNNLRKEFSESPATPGLFFDLKTLSGDAKYYTEDKNGVERVWGISAARQESRNRGEEFLVPNYRSTEWGLFWYNKKSWEKNTFNYGVRLDQKSTAGEELLAGGSTVFTAFKNRFTNVSGALGFTQELGENWGIKANLGSAFRAPNIAELASNGVHEGAFRYEIGNAALKPERSLYGDLSLGFHNEKVDADWSVFYNQINRYIFSRQQAGETTTVGGTVYPVFRFVQANGLLTGSEFSLTLHPATWIHLENSFAFTQGTNRSSR